MDSPLLLWAAVTPREDTIPLNASKGTITSDSKMKMMLPVNLGIVTSAKSHTVKMELYDPLERLVGQVQSTEPTKPYNWPDFEENLLWSILGLQFIAAISGIYTINISIDGSSFTSLAYPIVLGSP